ncbi:MAG: NADH:ubiquinone oxidoreductase subunit [Myxococcota bacterium]|jgi:NADH:ubiquinone oxidoreductase subunit
MDLISKIAIKMNYNQVGVDEFDNKYYEAKKPTNNRKKRCVIYRGMAEPSKVPAGWHGWLHYTSDDLPNNLHKHHWQKIHLPNLTGTKFAHFPAGSKKTNKERLKVSSDYQSWQPK